MKEAESHTSLVLRRGGSRSKGLRTGPGGWLRFIVHTRSQITVHILEQFYAIARSPASERQHPIVEVVPVHSTGYVYRILP